MDELFFAKAFDQSPVGMAFLKGNGEVLSANPALVGMLGRDLWAIVGAPLGVHLDPEDQRRWVGFFDQFRSGAGAPDSFESAYHPADGRRAWWSLHLSDLGLEWSGEACLFVVLQDVSVRRAAEQKLREATKAAEEANRAKSEFLANMSHEIRTPLFTITGMTDLLRLGDLKRDQAHHAGQIASAADHLLELVNDVLDFSKIEAGQMSLESIPLDLDEVAGRSLEVVSLGAYRKGLELILDLDPAVGRTWLGDPARLRQVLVNLLGNAVKFTQKGRITLSIGPGPSFRVCDTGIGIPEASRDRLFQVFSQADSSTTRQYGGTGLGLAISQKLVGLLGGGQIEFTSVPGEGTEFFFTLALTPVGEGEAPLAPGRGHSVLVVDDDPGVRDLLVRRLGEAGFAVEAVADRAQAHRSLGLKTPDAVLIDQELGPEDGWQLASEVRADPRLAGVPLVLMSLLRKTLEPSPRYPADLFRTFVDKPVNPRALAALLARGLDGDWSGNPAAGRPGGLLDRALQVRQVSPLRILVAEDHEVNRELFRLLLQSLGHEVILVEDGQQACEVAPVAQPQLIFMDLQMPVLNGYQAARELRLRGVVAPIVAVTASALKGELERCRDVGMDGILTKPFTRETLDEVVRSYAPRGALVTKGGVPTAEARPVASLAPGPEALDPEEALRVFLGNRTLWVNLLGRFAAQGDTALGSLDQALDRADAVGLRAGAHALKGSAANLTARPLAQAAEALEAAAAEGSWDQAPALVAAVKAAFDDFRAALRDLPSN